MGNQNPKQTPRQTEAEFIRQMEKSGPHRPGTISNAIITRRNGGVRHQFQDSIGGCSSNYR